MDWWPPEELGHRARNVLAAGFAWTALTLGILTIVLWRIAEALEFDEQPYNDFFFRGR